MLITCDLTIDYSLTELDNVAKQILKTVKNKTILFYGNMGTGKTTLIKALVKALGSIDDVSSPTYSIVNEYATDEGLVYHFDLYRLNTTEEAYDFGIEEYLQTTNWLFIEWPELIEDIINDDFSKILLETSNENKRIITLK